MVNTRLSSLSINEDEFKKTVSNGFNRNINFESIQTTFSWNRQRKVVWFNSPYYAKVKTNFGKVFSKPVRKHLDQSYCFKEMFYTDTIKLSYLCTPNIKNLINQHNSRLVKFGKNTNKKNCSCRNKGKCPLVGKYLIECNIYEATVTTTDQINAYFGSAGDGFKIRYNNHSFRSKGYKARTELSKYIWSLKDSNTEFSF